MPLSILEQYDEAIREACSELSIEYLKLVNYYIGDDDTRFNGLRSALMNDIASKISLYGKETSAFKKAWKCGIHLTPALN